MNHIRALSVDIGTRPRGTENDARASEYIRSQLASFGYSTELQRFPVEVGEYPLANVDLVAPQPRVIGAWGLAGSTLGTAEGEVVFAGIGMSAQFPANTAGRIALIERGEIFFSEKVANAQSAGATGVIIYNNETDGFQGNIDSSSIPAVSITGSDGQALRTLLEAGPVRVRVTTSADTASQNVIARPPGGSCRMVVGGHHDSVPNGPGANDNASGTGVVIEMARALAADGAFDDICFVLFGGEESGLLGSSYYVSRLSEDEREAMVGMLNFDMLAVGEGWPFNGSSELVNVAGEAAEALGIGYEITGGPEGVGSDHAPFAEAGIPAMMFNCFCDANWHTPGDRFEFIQPQRVEQGGNIGMGTIARLMP